MSFCIGGFFFCIWGIFFRGAFVLGDFLTGGLFVRELLSRGILPGAFDRESSSIYFLITQRPYYLISWIKGRFYVNKILFWEISVFSIFYDFFFCFDLVKMKPLLFMGPTHVIGIFKLTVQILQFFKHHKDIMSSSSSSEPFLTSTVIF